MSRYSSDDRTYISDDRYRRRRQSDGYRSPSEDEHRRRRSYAHERPQEPRKSNSTFETLGKAAIIVGIVQLAGGIFEKWLAQKREEKERQYRRQRRKEFQRAKANRRREEERFEREESSSEEEEDSPDPDRGRLEYIEVYIESAEED
ncbi:hypothetical protein LTR37_004078 [Vermiconidia calcicola]|uniref:Uncharacterized protein n=1 Tax=Vermiconidia calcicola TaxID=1690605 RepID=A0ACC3NNF0_9PEZI|nr:hypothetical protein LTR37_004078 [Vermiconidia calcicola]